MHIAVAAWLAGTGPSGANRRLRGLLEALPPLLQEHEKVTVLHQGPVPWAIPGLAFCQVPIPCHSTLRRVWAERRQLPKICRQLGIDLCELASLPVPARLPCPVSLTLHDLRDLDGEGGRPTWLSRWVLRRSLARTAGITVPSTYTAARLRAHDLPGSPTVIPNAVPPAAPTPPLPRQPPYLLHVGHLEARKNLPMLLRAHASCSQELWLCGQDAGMRRRLEQLAAALGSSPRLRFLGRVSDAQLDVLYAECQALVMPSRYEGFGLPALEGLRAGVPVLCSSAGALPEVVGSTARVLDPQDIQAWTAAIQDLPLQHDPALIASRRARAAAFSWTAAAAATLGHWRRLHQIHRQVAEPGRPG